MGQESRKQLKDLVAVHVFYVSLLEKQLGHGVPMSAEIRQAIALHTSKPDEPLDVNLAILELKLWLNLLDMAITPPMVRDELKKTKDNDTAHALLRYYVTKSSPRSNDRDKTDCVSTFLFRSPVPGSPNTWSRPEPDATYFFMTEAAQSFEKELQRALEDVPCEPIPAEHQRLVREFEFFHQELDEYRHFDQITDSSMVQRVRELKQSLGQTLYHPATLATISVWNDVFGRKFDDLFHEATRQIKTFAEHVQREGGSIMTRVDGDVTVKQLADIETLQILSEDYHSSQDQFRKVSKYKKAVDTKRSDRMFGPVQPRFTSEPVPPPVVQPQGPPRNVVQPIPPAAAAAAPPVAPSRVQEKQEKQPVPKPQTEVLAVPPSQAVQNAVQEGKIHSAREAIKNYVRTTDSAMANIVPIKKTRITLSTAELEAFRADYQGEKSFRADYVNVMMTIVAYLSRMIVEVDEYNEKAGSAYLWKPHADALSYLLNTLQRVSMEAEQLRNVARQRGLQDKAAALETSLHKLKDYASTVSQTLQAAEHRITS